MRKYKCLSLLGLLLCTSLSFSAAGQVAGDEDKEMFNRARDRDSQAIEEARKDWWTASMKTHEGRVQWWRDARFGMFIHWGVYSLPGGEWKGKKVGGYAEHLMRKEKISRKDYGELAHRFNPAEFDAEEWILTAKKAGMRYFIITAKHHDGFALYDSKVSDFDIVDQTPFRRDPMAELAAAAKKHGMKFGFYYSHAFDWEHPDAPGNDWEYNNPGGDKLLGGANWFDTHPEWLPKAQNYVQQKAIPQIRELIEKYHPDILWFDTPHKLPLSENIKILKAIREADPKVVVNGRLVRSAAANFGDYKNTADRPAEFYPVSGDWEAIPTTNESYGYSRFDDSHKPAGHFIRLLANAVSRGGNLLMNIGPMGNGAFDGRDLKILEGIGAWMDKNGESLFGAQGTSLPLQNWGVTTRKGSKLYLHVFHRPTDGRLVVGGLKSAVGKAYLLSDPQKQLSLTRISEKDVVIFTGNLAGDSSNTVLAVELKEELATDSIRYVSSSVPVTRLLAFDAKQQGGGFGFGDGKKDRYYVEGWKSPDQFLSWDFRTSAPVRFKVVATYLASEKSGGRFQAHIGNQKIGTPVLIEGAPGKVVREIGETVLLPGRHSLSLKPVEITGQELMKLLEVQLIGVDTNK
jgi:alpha-L-fucosidase